MSHNGLLRKLIEDAEQKVTMLHASGMLDQARALTELAATLKTLNIDDDPEKYIPNDSLDQIRLRYGLRSATFKYEEMSQALAAAGQVVNFAVDSAFDRGADLSIPNRQAAIALKNIAGSGFESAQFEVVSLPAPSLGYMRVNGINLTPGQQLTHADISGLEFIPLGEVLEPVEFIPPMLNEIYGEQSTEAVSGSTVSFKPDMSLIEVQSDRKILRVNSSNYSAPLMIDWNFSDIDWNFSDSVPL